MRDRALIDRILSTPRITKEETIRAIAALSLRNKIEPPSWQSMLRHKHRHIGISHALDPAPDDFVVKDDDVIVNSQDLSKAMVYALTILPSTEFDLFSESFNLYVCETPPIWTISSFESYLLKLVDRSIPSWHNEIRDRFRFLISKRYPQSTPLVK